VADESNCAALFFGKTGHAAHESGFVGAICSDQRDTFTALDPDIEAMQRLQSGQAGNSRT
jgi:hypothetical protein